MSTENEKRAERAYRALLIFAPEDEYESREKAAVDLITDLLHMLDLQYGLEPDAALDSARHHFKVEREEVES